MAMERPVQTWCLGLSLLGLVAACDGGRGAADTGVVGQAVTAAGGERAEVALRAARAQAADWLGRIPAGRERDFGFADRAELERAEPGAPWRLVTYDAAALRATAPGELPAPRLLGLWRVPLEVDGRARVLLTLERRQGALRAVAIGAAGLAADLDALERRHAGPLAGRILLRIFPLRADFAMVGDGLAYPLASARAYLPLPARPSGSGGLGAGALRRLLLDGLEEVAR